MSPRLACGLWMLCLCGCGPAVDPEPDDTDTDTDTDTVADTDVDTDVDTDIEATVLPFTVAGTDQTLCYDDAGEITCPAAGSDWYGQDAQTPQPTPSWSVVDGVVEDLVTGLVWQQVPPAKMYWDEAAGYCDALSLGGRDDWRVPTTKQLYSLIQFDGATGHNPGGDYSVIPDDARPYLDDEVFTFDYGDTEAGERYIDAQFATTTVYVSRVMADDAGLEAGEEAFFGVNFADGRIKGYATHRGQDWYVRCVAGCAAYGDNDLEADGEVALDRATGLMWPLTDSGEAMDWPGALDWCESLELGGYSDWRLPNAKELQGLVDYSRSPDTTDSATIDPMFTSTAITAEDGSDNYGWYWTSTTHLDGIVPGADAVYIAFGEALGWFTGRATGEEMFLDVHGAGVQKGDPKTGSADDYPQWGNGPQGDVRRVYNLARCVRTE